MKHRNRPIWLIASVVAVAQIATQAPAQGAEPLWAHAPETISSEWSAVLSALGQGRDAAVPSPDDVQAWQALQDADSTAKIKAAAPFVEAFNGTFRDITLGGVPVVEVMPDKLARDDKIAVYLHGGAYVFNSARGAITSAILLADETGLTVMAVDYTLAPHAKWQETTDEVLSVFAALGEQDFAASDIVLYGDSAGGGLSAGSTLKMRDQGMEMPAALVLWSPWTDISETGDSYVTLQDAEPFFTYQDVLGPSALAYADETDHRHPYVSPVYGDFTKGFPPTLIQGGIKEIFLSNFVRLYQALDQAGQTVKLDLYEGMPHVFMAALPESPESRVAVRKTGDWVSEFLLDE
ncbi:alpha/beta hydrolase [Falsiruegeria mediterranea]|uniref:Acetyl-hydrolase LipR n=1 Tax=Falsiruegeria mediterranea M17 TaxID=1200281 RepID=A0A2R8CAI9_9RHOB|nr:alpha/beta hydrolase [Falsiruegeria mediterranea]SPJ29442.1 Putative acetyl-hydrolase LipR [Falsiruegeria mediterranea M17]